MKKTYRGALQKVKNVDMTAGAKFLIVKNLNDLSKSTTYRVVAQYLFIF